MISIADVGNGEGFRVKKVTLTREIGKRLADMGFTKGVEGVVVRCALFNDPLQVRIYGYNISIRRSEASGIEIERVVAAGKGGCDEH